MERSLIAIVAFALLSASLPYAHTEGATPGQCAVLVGANPSMVCDENTVVRDVDTSLGITDDVAAAKKYLSSIAQDLRNSAAPPTEPSNINRLNNTFAVCSAKFLKAYESVYGKGSVVIVSAYRDGPSGANRRAGGAPGSNHTRGLALDVNPKGRGSYQTLWSFAQKNSDFGVCFPHLGADRPHMILAGIGGGESAKCASQGVTQKCSNSPDFDPRPQETSSSDDNLTTQESPSSQNITDDLKQSLGTPPIGGGSDGGGSSGGGGATTPGGDFYYPNEHGGDLGSGENEDFLGDGAPVFKEIFGDFGEYGEGEQVRDVLGYDTTGTRATTTPRYSILSSTSTSSSLSECENGVETRNIYGNIICIRDNTRDVGSQNGEDSFGGDGLISTTISNGSVSKTVTSLMNYILPIRHLLGDGLGGNSQDIGIVGGNSFEAYDVYRPTEGIARGNNDRSGLQTEDIIAWMIQNDLIEEDSETQHLTLSVLLGLLRPIFMYISLVLFGTGTHAVNTALDLANNI